MLSPSSAATFSHLNVGPMVLADQGEERGKKGGQRVEVTQFCQSRATGYCLVLAYDVCAREKKKRAEREDSGPCSVDILQRLLSLSGLKKGGGGEAGGKPSASLAEEGEKKGGGKGRQKGRSLFSIFLPPPFLLPGEGKKEEKRRGRGKHRRRRVVFSSRNYDTRKKKKGEERTGGPRE